MNATRIEREPAPSVMTVFSHSSPRVVAMPATSRVVAINRVLSSACSDVSSFDILAFSGAGVSGVSAASGDVILTQWGNGK
jgi:hypothetical protein